MNRPLLSRLLALSTLLLILPVQAQAQKGSSSSGVLKATLTLDDTSDHKPARSYMVSLRKEGAPAKIQSGSSFAFETSRSVSASKHSGKDVVPVVSYSYHQIGFQATLRASNTNDPGRVRINGSLEDTRVRKLTGNRKRSTRPDIFNFEHSFDVTVAIGERYELSRIVESDEGALVITLSIE